MTATKFRLSIANAAWGQEGYEFLDAYLDALARYYGSGVRLADFAEQPESARQAINEWVAGQTEDRIQDLLPEGSITGLTRLVLINAIYFKADWEVPFEASATEPGEFTLLSGEAVSVDMMRQRRRFQHAEAGGVEAIELEYKGGRFSMVLLVPQAGDTAFVEELSSESVAGILDQLRPKEVILRMPKFTFTSEFALKPVLTALGMEMAFVPNGADFSGIDGTRDLFISDVFHKAFVAVDEEGTEAAAATGVVIEATSAPPMLTVDRPFVFLIRDRETGAVVFIGRVVDPRGG